MSANACTGSINVKSNTDVGTRLAACSTIMEALPGNPHAPMATNAMDKDRIP
jgi:hypothetical protein